MTLADRLAAIRKAIVSLLGVLTALLAANLLPEPVAGWVSTAVGALTVLLTYWVSNEAPSERSAD